MAQPNSLLGRELLRIQPIIALHVFGGNVDSLAHLTVNDLILFNFSPYRSPVILHRRPFALQGFHQLLIPESISLLNPVDVTVYILFADHYPCKLHLRRQELFRDELLQHLLIVFLDAV